ncbi:TPA: transcriptional regulator [Enterobacter kobei]|nr:transcriptional regulator [Enterobacter kobei]
MFTSDALNFFGTKTKLARAAGVQIQSIYAWKELVPEARAQRLSDASNGELVYDKFAYDRHRQSRRKAGKNTSSVRKGSD